MKAYTIDTSTGYCHWTEGLTLVIQKDGVTIELVGDEIKQLINALPSTVGEKY